MDLYLHIPIRTLGAALNHFCLFTKPKKSSPYLQNRVTCPYIDLDDFKLSTFVCNIQYIIHPFRPELLRDLFPSEFHTKFVYAILMSPARAVCTALSNLLI